MKYVCYKFFLVLRVGAHVMSCLEDFITSRAILFQASARKGMEQSEGIQFILASCVSVSIWTIGMELHSILASIAGVIIFPYRLGALPYQFMVFLFGVVANRLSNFSMYVVLWLYNAQLYHSDSPVGCDGILLYL